MVAGAEEKRVVLTLKPPKKKIHCGLMFIDLSNVTGLKKFAMRGESNEDAPQCPKIFVSIEDFNWANILLKHISSPDGMIFPVKPIVYTDASNRKTKIRHFIPDSFSIVFYKKTNADIVMATDIVSLGRDLMESAKNVDLEITLKIFSGDYDFIYPIVSLIKKADAAKIPIHVEVFAWKGSISAEWKEHIPSCRVVALNYCFDHFSPSMQKRVEEWNKEIRDYEREHKKDTVPSIS